MENDAVTARDADGAASDRGVVTADNDGFGVGAALSAGGLGVTMTTRVVAIELSQGRCPVLDGGIVDRDWPTFGRRRNEGRRGEFGSKRASEGERKGVSSGIQAGTGWVRVGGG
jgi:hypothetical protein